MHFHFISLEVILKHREEANRGKESVGQQACFISYMKHECAFLKKRDFHSCPDIYLAHNLEASNVNDSSTQITPLLLGLQEPEPSSGGKRYCNQCRQ